MASRQRKTDRRTKPSNSPATTGADHRRSLTVREFEKCLVGIVVDGVARGTGFIVNTGLVITCRHVLISQKKDKKTIAGDIQVRFIVQDTLIERQSNPSIERGTISGGQASGSIVATLERSSEELDLALLKFKLEHHPAEAVVATLDSNLPESGDKLSIRCFYRSKSGGSYKWDPALVEYVASGLHPTNGQQEKFKSSSVTEGYSGAPLFNSRGKVVGIAANINRTDENGRGGEDNYFISSSPIQVFADQYLPRASVHESRDKALRDSIIRVIECSKVTEDLAKSWVKSWI